MTENDQTPSEEPTRTPAREEAVDRACSDFENQWRAGNHPQIESFLNRVASPWRNLLLQELIASEIELRQDDGQTVDSKEYLRRFPDSEPSVRAGWALIFDRPAVAPRSSHTSDISRDSAVDAASNLPAPGVSPDPQLPERIGRYEPLEFLGRGGFGCVYRAHDPQLGRHVAIKVPHDNQLRSPDRVEAFLQEARSAAQLKHPGLVTVYDIQHAEDCFYIVEEYIEGQDLAHWIREHPFSIEDTVRLTKRVVEAVGFAHRTKGLVHRDLKPANLLIDQHGQPHVADFGLALTQDLQRIRVGDLSGTPEYMSPEQVRGEAHLLDGRSDLWSVGVILYELLTGQRPFSGSDHLQVFDEIQHRHPRPLRMLKPEIPAELERICLRLLSKFLQLVPGARDRHGLPDSIRFWKLAIEETDPDKTFRVGLIYGPSGCGKSSLVKAGLLPRLDPQIACLYVEATSDDTELRLQRGIQRLLGAAAPELTLPEILAGIREGWWESRDRKVLLILDQFEQWLHARRSQQDTQLIDALRHCDGERMQCMVLVRDDFWMPATRFLRELEVPLLEGENSTAVDLFGPYHARNVLAAFGQAYGRLPEDATERTRQQESFLDQAVSELTQDDTIICVRLALFAEMFKDKPWDRASLSQVGGAEGLGMAFLEETFSAATAPAAHRHRQEAAQSVLKLLLPAGGSEIRGNRQSSAALLEVSGYRDRPHEFAALLQILDKETRLITPTVPREPEADPDRRAMGDDETQYYQLTHDYLIPSLRDWLTRKQRETRRGRAELRLAERSSVWNAKPEHRHLPSLWEYLNIRLLTRRKAWTDPQQKMMRKATRYFNFVGAEILAVMFIVPGRGDFVGPIGGS